MEKKWLFIIGISVVLVATLIFLGISAKTGAVIYGKCWNFNDPIEKESELALRMQGCFIEKDSKRVCCPFEECPSINEVSCS